MSAKIKVARTRTVVTPLQEVGDALCVYQPLLDMSASFNRGKIIAGRKTIATLTAIGSTVTISNTTKNAWATEAAKALAKENPGVYVLKR